MMPKIDPGAALLVIDVQKGFEHPSWGPRNNLNAEAQMGKLLAAWRASGWPVIHVYHDSADPEGCFVPGSRGHPAMDFVQARPGEPVYHKSVNSAFIGTSLEEDLHRNQVDTLVIVGLTTNHCVSTTARMAGNLGFRTFVVSDATATFDRAAIDGTVRPADEVHAAALSDLDIEFARVISTADALPERAIA
jgi:nicotinamidase-related amidase